MTSDPFVVGTAIMSAAIGGVGFLELRGQQPVERQEGDRFRAAWFEAHRSTLDLGRIVDEFEAYVLEERLGEQPFLLGAVRLTVDRERQASLRWLHSRSLVTARRLGTTMDNLSDLLDARDAGAVHEAYEGFEVLATPHDYSEVVAVGHRAVALYVGLLARIDRREQ